jgi:hypothetical protein
MAERLLPSDSRRSDASVVADPCEIEDVLDNDRASSVGAPIASFGTVSGEGDSRRRLGGCSFKVAIVVASIAGLGDSSSPVVSSQKFRTGEKERVWSR